VEAAEELRALAGLGRVPGRLGREREAEEQLASANMVAWSDAIEADLATVDRGGSP
jgi:hypothetical protein